MRKFVLVLIASLVLGLAPATVVAAAPPVPLPGAPGIGDPYFQTDGNGGYQVDHYRLRIAYDPPTDQLTGEATLRATATQALSRFNLDLDGLAVDSVRVDGQNARWTRAADELQIRPARALRKNRPFTVVVRYHGVPVPVVDEFGESGFFHTNDGAVVVGQPHVADTWYPVNDHPLDKATYRIELTVPRALQAISNGALASISAPRAGKRTWTWVMNKPMASYLTTAAIGRFDVDSYRTGRVSYIDAVDSTLFDVTTPSGGSAGDRAEAALAKQPAIIDFLETIFGRYPFGQAGGIVDNQDIGFALENQARPVYDYRFFTGATPIDDDSVVVHELAHQWAGDSVSLARWRDIWLNEGFASYMEWLWSQEQGRGAADEIFAEYASTPATDDFWNLRIGNPGPDNIFDGAVYDRGAMTMHALRERIGDRAFFRLTQRWMTRYAYGNATTRQFVDLAERISGQNLDPFFRVWIYTPSKPAVLEEAPAAARTSASASVRDQVQRMRARHQLQAQR